MKNEPELNNESAEFVGLLVASQSDSSFDCWVGEAHQKLKARSIASDMSTHVHVYRFAIPLRAWGELAFWSRRFFLIFEKKWKFLDPKKGPQSVPKWHRKR